MRLISIDAVVPGMKLARPLYRLDDGKILLRSNVELKPHYISRLKEMKFSHLYIWEPGDSNDEHLLLDPIRVETRLKAGLAFKEITDLLHQTNQVNVKNLRRVVAEMIDQIFNNDDVIYNMMDIRSYDNYTYAHSINVCTISLIIGNSMKINRNDLEYLGMGALLHDIGKINIDSKILNKPGSLEPVEYEAVKRHPRDGYQLLKEKIEVSFVSSHIAFQHHEREDGSGYPRGLTGDKIHRFAKIVAVADIYDAMTSHRIYRAAIPSHLVLAEIKQGIEKKFDRQVVESLEKIVAPYPVGATLLLNNGEVVTVKNATRSECIVKVTNGERKGCQFNLFRYPELKVIKYLV